MWKLSIATDDYERRRKRFDKKRDREVMAVFANLDRFLGMLQEGLAVEQASKAGFVHPEPDGVLAIDQKGGGANLAQMRLYVWPEKESHVIHVITLGDKQTQQEDLKFCREVVATMRKTEGDGHG